MDTIDPKAYDTVLSINPYENTFYEGYGTQLALQRDPAFGKKQFAISYLNTNDFITAQIAVSKNIPEEDLAFVIETKIYEELALDLAIEYSIDFVEISNEGDEKERLFHVFIVDPIVLDETFANVISKIQYIDQIIPVPLLLKSLYVYELVEGYGAHCYIYFQENDAFFTLYNNQEFIYTKSLKYSFVEMHERFCELLGEQVDFEEFKSLLSNEGLGTQNEEYQKYLIKLFGELFLHINDVLTYAKRAYDIDAIEEIFIGSQLGAIVGLDEYCQTYLGFEAKAFDFSYGFSTDAYVDQIHQLMQIYTQCDEALRYNSNFSIYHRPPPFFQRQSGKLLTVVAASLVAAFAYPVTYWTLSYAESVHKTMLEKTYKETHIVKLTREKTINLKLAQKAEAQKLLDAENQLFAERKATLTKIHEVKVGYPMKGSIVASLSSDLNRFKVGLSDILYKQNEKQKVFTFSLIASKDKEITDLLEFLTKNRTKHFHYNIESIFFDEKDNVYRGDLKVVLK